MVSYALDSDRDQPATLNADDFEIDLVTGVRIYRGNVVFTQGSIRMDCDELVTHLNDDGGLDKAICTGEPGRFKQRPQGSEDDLIGTAWSIRMDGINQEVILKTQAKVVQGPNALSGRIMIYSLETEKVTVKGGDDAVTPATATKTPESSQAVQEAPSDTQNTDNGSSRPSLVIQPRKKKQHSE